MPQTKVSHRPGHTTVEDYIFESIREYLDATITLDIPQDSPDSWALNVKNLIRVEKLLHSKDHELKRDNWSFLAKQILPLLLSTRTSIPDLNRNFLRSNFHHAYRRSNASTLLRQSSLFRRCATDFDLPANSIADRQLSARLHVYSALPLELRESEKLEMPGSQYLHPFARSRIYDLRRYTSRNYWGPFMDDGSGRIDWERVQAIYIVLGYGLRMLSERSSGNMAGGVGWGMGLNGGGDEEMWQGLGKGSYKSMTGEGGKARDEDLQSSAATTGSTVGDSNGYDDTDEHGVPPVDWFYERYDSRKEAEFQHQQAIFAAQDPYGVKGTWMRIVNFLDYHDLFAFNFSHPMIPHYQERDSVSTAEAFRLILLKLWVTRIEWLDEDEGGPDDWETVAGSTGSSPAATRDDEKPEIGGNSLMNNCDKQDTVASPDAETGEASSSSLPTEPSRSKVKSKYPIVHFAGRSRSLHVRWDPNANSYIRGSNPFYAITGYVRAYPAPDIPQFETELDDLNITASPMPNPAHVYPNRAQSGSQVSTAPMNPTHVYQHSPKVPSETVTGLKPDEDLVIRWTTFSVFHGEERWRSEGVQIGGLKSARGILGNWFDKDFDEHGPAGPTGFWKMGDGVEIEEGGRAGNRRGGGGSRVVYWGEDDDDDENDDDGDDD